MTSPVGHEQILTFLEQTVEQGRPAHGYLFTGREGVGKKLAAEKFACMLNCPDLSRHSAESCPVCRRIISGNHPDFMLETPEKGRIRIERVRQIQSFFLYPPVEGRHRVCVIDDAHTMNRAAQNALLKTLEEPPSRRILVLVSSKPSLLLPTVRSRCRRIRFGAIPLELLTELLEQRGVAPEKAPILAAMAGGSMAHAMEMDHPRFLALRDKVIAALEEPASIGIAGILELSAEVARDRRTATEAVEIAMTFLRDVLLARIGCETSSAVHMDSLDRIRSAAQHLSTDQIMSAYDELVAAAELIEAEINANRNLILDVALLRILRISRGSSMGVASSSG